VGGDAGTPIVASHPDSAAAEAFVAIAQAIRSQVERS
jgi:MinD-like ATPase involved in chromosome partitioning or flagellar assembly